MRTRTTVSFVLAAGLVGGCLGSSSSDESLIVSRLSGAIFTTLVDGSRVNANIYNAKSDVYLDGGPGDGAPQSAAALPDGDYYFQVTDPSGKTLLSTDDISCRRVEIDEGVITRAYATASCGHMMGADQDHDAVTVQLLPYNDTPNPGGEYKVWMTPVDQYDADSGVHGFLHAFSKTDNYKVREITTIPPPPPPPPCCGDGTVDSGEECDDGNTSNGDGCSSTCQTELPPPPPESCCGDGTVDSGEACDDGNTSGGDGCSATCTVEPPPPPAPCCGDGTVDSGEECDDGNTTNGDGCSSVCMQETCVP